MELQLKIASCIKENESHRQKINRARKLLKDVFPTDAKSFQNLSEEEIAYVDQLIYRFTKMQDSMGLRLIPALHTWLEQDTMPRPFLDILNRLEKLGIIDSASDWQFFRNLRNNLAHDYPDSIVQTVETLNILYAEMDKFLGIFQNLYDAYHSRSRSF